MQNFRHSSFRLSPNVYFDKLLLLKVYKISAKKVQRSYASWPWRVMQNLKKNRLLVSKMTRISVILIRALKSLTNLHFDWSLLYKVYNIWLKKVQKSYISRHWRVMPNLTCGLENDTKNLADFHHNTLKCQNWDFDEIFLSKVKNAWAKNL